MTPYVDASRAPVTWYTRIYFVEELWVSALMGAAAGWRPQSGTCAGVATVMLIISAAHLVYLLCVRPYLRRLDMLFAGAIAIMQRKNASPYQTRTLGLKLSYF
jgi:hypothetical protein